MRQVLFTIPYLGFKVYGYGLMLFLAFIASINLAAWRARREKIDENLVHDFALWLFVGGIVGARGFYVAQYWGTKVRGVWEILKFWEGGIVFYGSVIGGTVAFLIFWMRREFPMRAFLDVIAPSLALGIAFGRIGCFFTGCCYGDVCKLPWAVSFPAESPPWESQVKLGLIGAEAVRSLPVHPTQIYSAIDGFLLLALMTAYFPLRRRDGEVIGILMVAYPVTRFLIEHLRSDEAVFFAGMTISQTVSVVLLACGLLYWAWLATLPKTRHADSAGDGSPRELDVAAGPRPITAP